MQEKRSILIVEDSRELVDLFYRRFESSYRLHFALDGEEGLAMARALKPEIMLLDVNLPKMSGFEVLREVRSQDSTRDITVLMITAQTGTDNVVMGLSLGADDYIAKPFNFVELAARIKSHLTIKDLQRQLVDIERLKTLREVAVSFNHEINNPLMSIAAFAHFLKHNSDASADDSKASVEGIISEVGRISDIVKKLSAATNAASVDYGPGIKMIDFGRLTEES